MSSEIGDVIGSAFRLTGFALALLVASPLHAADADAPTPAELDAGVVVDACDASTADGSDASPADCIQIEIEVMRATNDRVRRLGKRLQAEAERLSKNDRHVSQDRRRRSR